MWRDACRVMSTEWLKLRRSRATATGLVVYVAVLGVLYAVYAIASLRSFAGIRSGFYVAGAVLSTATTPLAFVAAMLVTFSIGREFSQGTIHNVWARPLTRQGWLLGKTISAASHLAVFGLLTLVLVIVAAGIQLGFSDLMEKDFLIHTGAALWGHLALTVCLTWLALSAVVVFAAVPALSIGSPGGAFAVSLIAGFICQLLDGWDPIKPFLISTYLSLPLDQFVAMSKGLPLPQAWGTLLTTCLFGLAAWIAVGWLWAWVLVRRKEVLN